MNAGVKAHLAHMAGHAGRDFQSAHFVGRVHRALDPAAGEIIGIGQAGMLAQHEDRMVVPGNCVGAVEPGVVRNTADADLAGIHEIGAALDVDGAAVEIARHGRLFLHRLALDKAAEQFAVLHGGPAELAVGGRGSDGRCPRAFALYRYHAFVAVQAFKRKRT